MKTDNTAYSFILFPFLKTQDEVSIGKLTFKSTDNTNNLTSEQKEDLKNIADMLYLQNNLRIKNASYALYQNININDPESIDHLKKIRNFVAYCYTAPRHEFGDIFLSPEHSSMVIFSPGRVPKNLVNPDHHVEDFGASSIEVEDIRGEINGYSGLYDFKHYFWASKGSRLYGPEPHLTLNISQDLGFDIKHAVEARCDYYLLYQFLTKPTTKTLERFFVALQWFNAANSDSNDSSASIVDISIAFEALLNLPGDQKTDRLIDAVSMLLGRTSRLDIWVKQFYDARSQIVHEGILQQAKFIATNSSDKNKGQQYQSLLSYGRYIFQLCLGTLLTGLELSVKSKLEEKFVTNEERFHNICKILSNNEIEISDRLNSISPIILAIDQYKYIPESNLKIETLIGTTSIFAKLILQNNNTLSKDLEKMLSIFNSKSSSKNCFDELEMISILAQAFRNNKFYPENYDIEIFSNLIHTVWYYVSMHYFWLKEQKS